MRTHRRRSHIGSTVAALTAVVYFGLMCLVSSCAHALPSGSSSGEHTHHQHEASHSPLCAWACQAISQSGPSAVAQVEVVSPVVLVSVVSHVTQPSACPPVSLHPRAPPVCTLG
jgi:hypothetical protein